MKKDTKNLISLLWVSKGYMLVGTALAVAGSALAMRGAYGEGTHAMLAGMIRLDKEKSLEIIDKVRDEKDSIDLSTARATGICGSLFFVYHSGNSRLRCSANSGNIVLRHLIFVKVFNLSVALCLCFGFGCIHSLFYLNTCFGNSLTVCFAIIKSD